MEFRLLGPLDVRVDGHAVALGGPKQRALLALLRLQVNRVVSTDRLMEAFGYRGWMRRNASKALKRLRGILEDNEGRGVRATVAGL